MPSARKWKMGFCLILGLFWLPSSTLAQEALDQIAQKLEKYAGATLQEKIYLHTDQSFYCAGDIAWFRLYYVDQEHQPLSLSKVAYLELLDDQQQPVLQQTLLLEKGGTASSLYIPLSVTPGHYRLRCYTNLMKNRGTEVFFEKELTVVNPLMALNLQQATMENPFNVGIFPEGGHLVNGIESRVAVKVQGHNGKGQDFVGQLIRNSADTLLQFTSEMFGMGSFHFTPKEGETYSIRLAIGEKTVEQPLPKAQKQGVSLQLIPNGAQTLSCNIHSRLAPGSPQNAYLLVQNAEKVRLAQAMLLKENGTVTVQIEKAKLGAGVSHFTLFNASGKPLCERLYFIKPSASLQLRARPEQAAAATRSSVKVTFELLGKTLQAAPQLSLAVYRQDALPKTATGDIRSYFWLESYLQGIVEQPTFYLSADTAGQAEATELLMLTHGWRRFDWEKVLREAQPAIRFLPEYEGRIVQGKVTDKDLNRTQKRVEAFLSVPGRQFKFYSQYTEQNGQLQMITEDIFGIKKIVAQTNPETDSLYKFEIFPPYSQDSSQTPTPSFWLDEGLRESIAARSRATQVQQAYYQDVRHRFSFPTEDTLPFYGRPEHSYLLDDFTRFPTMEEVMREYVHEASVRKSKGEYHFYVFNRPKDTYFRKDPLVLIDGLPVFDVDQVIAVDPLKIQRLDVIPRRVLIGNSMFYGLISYTSYQGDALEWLPLNPEALTVNYDGLQPYREFHQPDYSQSDARLARLPDFRQLLYWSPTIPFAAGSSSAECTFFTSDWEGTYLGVAEGMTPEGKLVSTSFTFEVKADGPK